MRKFGIAVLLLIGGCSLSEVIDLQTPRERKSEPYYPQTKADSTEKADTARVPISFDVSVDNWGDEDITEW